MTTAVRLGVDVGGTFTDIVLLVGESATTAKVPTTADQSMGVIEGITLACERAEIEPGEIDDFRHAMTVATNALLEGDGAKTALVTTAGFADVLEIGRQARPELYDLTAKKPEPLVPASRRYELEERTTPDGIETPVDPDLDGLIEQLDDDTESIAISLLHSYAHKGNEQTVKQALADKMAGHKAENQSAKLENHDGATERTVIASHETLQEFREYERTATTVVDAYVTPVIQRYLERLVDRTKKHGLPEPVVMQSNGGIADASTVSENAVTTVLSGPAAGVVGATLYEDSSLEGTITFDMGGTSCDVGLVRNGKINRTTDTAVGGYPVHVPMVDIETVGAGGGSIAWVDAGGALRVGPESAGADPGPVCYGKGGTQPTVTDAAVVLGYLGSETTLGQSLSLDVDAAEEALDSLASEAGLDNSLAAANGIYRVANATMTRAIRRMTLERGHDPRSFGLVGFGGAGPMHAAAIADQLDIPSIQIPRANGVLSALGLLAADERYDESLTIKRTLEAIDRTEFESYFEELIEQVPGAGTPTGEDRTHSSTTYMADMRYRGQSHELTVELPETFDRVEIAELFHTLHNQRRGYRLEDAGVELVTIRVSHRIEQSSPAIEHDGTRAEPSITRDAYFGDEFMETSIYDRETLEPGKFDGPAIFEGGESTIVVPPEWDLQVTTDGTIVMEVAE